ncbi:MAG: DUF4294 domain-containing protein [Bacteroidia bacterium]|nr:DUF4294 domain-containing protein [Bacteroidia bacterium]
MRVRAIHTILWLVLGTLTEVRAQGPVISDRFYLFHDEETGESLLWGNLDPIEIGANAPSGWELTRGRQRLEKFSRLRWNVHMVYPYARKVSAVLQEVDAHIQTLPTEKARKAYIKSRESALFGEYEDDLRHMTRSQGKALVKLVCRQTGKSSFDLIKENKSAAAAIFWQSVGMVFGINLKSIYDLEEDMMIEEIARELDNGGYNIYWKQYNYTLN